MKKQNHITIFRCFAKKPACLEHLGGANIFAVLLTLFSTFAFSRLMFVRLNDAVC
jgi:hypothetical protein